MPSRLTHLPSILLGPRWRDPRHPDLWLLVLLLATLALRVLLLVQPLPWVVSMLTADDFFYYAQTAFHVAHGHGSTADGGLTTHNGYHPLFLWLLVTGFALGLSKATMIFVALSLLAATWLAVVAVAYRIGRALGGHWSALTAPAVLGLNVEFAKVSLSGFETALAAALLLAVLLACVERRAGWVIGLLLGLAGLARLDSGLAAIPVAIALAHQRRWRDLVLAGGVAAAVVSPWVLWSWVNFGSPLPLSGVVKAWYGQPDDLWRGPVVFARESAYRLLGFRWRDLLPAELALALGTLVVAEGIRRGRSRWWLLLYAVGAPVAFAVLTGAHHLPQFNRYCVPAFALLAVVFFVRLPGGQRLVLAAVLASVLWANQLYLGWALRTPPLRSYVGLAQREVPEVLAEIAGPGDVVGCFDSGAGGTWTARYRRYLQKKGITVMVGGTGFSWVRLFPDLAEWPVLHPPLALGNGREVVFLRVPAWESSADADPSAGH